MNIGEASAVTTLVQHLTAHADAADYPDPVVLAVVDLNGRARKALESRPVITTGVMPTNCNNFRPCPSSVLKRLSVSPDSENSKPPSVKTPSTSKNATLTPWASNNNAGSKFSTGAIK